ncbi:MAG: DUF4232 domain-containing protein [Pseudonocardia sp.]|nr:DUF4232 domain-containing protein [Pseudonocardia sp.]
MSGWKRVRIAAAGALAAAVLAACAPPQAPTPGTTAPVPPSAAPTSPPPPTGTGVPRCTTGELRASLGVGDAGAGSVFRPLVLTNIGSRTCELVGHPGVSYVAGDDGHQVGPAAVMDGPRTPQVSLAPGESAVAPLRMVNVGVFDPAACQPVPVRGLRVYPPGDTASLFVPFDGGRACSITPPEPQLYVQAARPA